MIPRETVKALLDSLCQDGERDFRIVYSRRSPRLRDGNYRARQKRITLYPNKHPNSLNFIGVALHELAHHLHFTRHFHELSSRFHQGKRVPVHGKDFKEILDQILGAFNFRHREHFKGVMKFDRRRPGRPPRFVPFGKKVEQCKSSAPTSGAENSIDKLVAGTLNS